MKYINAHEVHNIPRYEYITGYEIDGNNLSIKYANKERKKIVPNTPENIESIINSIKKQIARFGLSEEQYNDVINKYNRCLLVDALYCLGSYICFLHIESYGELPKTAFILVLLDLISKSSSKSRYQQLEEVLKNQFFLENEELINYDIRKRFNEEQVGSDEEINLITINDIDDMSLTELRETVELIKQNYGEELKVKKLI